MRRFRFLAIGVLVVGMLASGRAATPPPPVEIMYADAVSKEVAVHTALADAQAPPTVLKAVRTVVSDYEAIVRAYPTSGYSDDALWRAGLVSLDAFKKFGDAHDKDAAVRLLRMLVAQYPTSKLAKNVPSVLATIDNGAIATAPRPTGTATLSAIHRVSLPDVVRVTIDLDAEVAFRDERIDGPPRIFLDFPSTKTVASLQDKTLRFDGDTDPVHQIRVGRHDETTTRVVLDAAGIGSYSVYALYNPNRLVVDCVRTPVAAPSPQPPVRTTLNAPRPPATAAIRPPVRPALQPIRGKQLVSDLVFSLVGTTSANGATIARLFEPEAADTPVMTAAAAPAPATPDRNFGGGLSIARQLGLGVSRIVIDPGHGGHDPGAQGKGVSEAELVLDVALRLEKLLQKVPGTDVILTRRTDDFVPLQERTAIANREHADLFLSIHANASENGTARGIETYYLNFASSMSSAAVAARENAASGGAMASAPDIVKSIALNNKIDESRDLATDVQRAMIDKLKLSNKTVRDLGVKQAPFVVLIGAAMPSVLAEVSFVTNEQEAKLLKSAAYRDRIAEALYAAVRKYQTSLKSIQTVAREP